MNNSIKTLSKILIAPMAVAIAFIATPALANCAQDIESVNTLAQSAALSDEDRAKVAAAAAAAAEKQAAGDEDGCVAEITSAKMILRIE